MIDVNGGVKYYHHYDGVDDGSKSDWLNWDDLKTYCASLGGRMLRWDTQEEFDAFFAWHPQ